jgi:DNA (cytosine-5)-methyltransferase 1
MKILNLYAGIWWNRKLWEWDITAVEFNPEIAKIYQDLYPNDTVIVWDAHQYLLDHYKEFDFIWSSPPCQSHSSFRHNICVRFRGTEPKYPDMKLYEEIIFLKHHSICPYVVENVKPYYEPLIPWKMIQRHLFWSNFDIPDLDIKKDNIRTAQIADLEAHHWFDLSKYKLSNKRQILRNCVYPEVWLHVLNNISKHKTHK